MSIGPIIPLTLQQVAAATDLATRTRISGSQAADQVAEQQAVIAAAQASEEAGTVHRAEAGDRTREHSYEHDHERRRQRRRRQNADHQFELLSDDEEEEDDLPHIDVDA